MPPPVPPTAMDPSDPSAAFATGAFHAHFAELPDPRVTRGRRHRLLDIVTVAVCAVIRGADTWVDVAAFGQAKAAWLRTFLPLPGGIPSHDTFGRVFAALDPAAFETAFVGGVQALVATAPTTEPVDPVTVDPVTGAAGTRGASGAAGPVVAIDGKTARRSHDRSAGRGPPHLVSAWSAPGLGRPRITRAWCWARWRWGRRPPRSSPSRPCSTRSTPAPWPGRP